MDPERVLTELATGDHADALIHIERLPARSARLDSGLEIHPDVALRLKRLGIEHVWSHQGAGIRRARAGSHVAIATGTASGKSLVYLLHTFERLLDDPKATALYLFPTKALAQDQLRHVRAFALPCVKAAVYDGDTPRDERAWIRRTANLVISNPDMLNASILPGHQRWAGFLHALRIVVIDEMHTFRGVFGSQVACVIRRLRRLAARYGAEPTFVAASATIGDPAGLATSLTGLPFEAVIDEGAPRAEKLFAFWNPPFRENGGGQKYERYSANSQAAGLLAGLVRRGARTIAFTHSRRGAELVAAHTRDLLADERADLARRVAAYRAGYLPDERRALERDLSNGVLMGIAATSALELGIDIGGLDACVLAGYPGTLAATWQRAGRAGRARSGSLAILIAQDDPLDQFIVSHPEEIFGKPHETPVVDHTNPHILDPHVAAAAYEAPLTDDDRRFFGDKFDASAKRLEQQGLLRSRGGKHHWIGEGVPAGGIDLRGAGHAISIVEHDTGRLLGTTDAARARHTVHTGAIYLHQGEQFAVIELDMERSVALVEATNADYYTQARDVTDITIREQHASRSLGSVELYFGEVAVTNQVTSYVRKRLFTNEMLDERPLDLAVQQLDTVAVWYSVPDRVLKQAALEPAAIPGAAHAAEHAAIGLMPLIATCDRWDIGGVSTALHRDTGMCSVFIYDGYPGGVGFARRSYDAGARHLQATLDVIRMCTCESGCPSCVQSPKCGNGNEPLDKDGAAQLLAAVLGDVVQPV